ncbi:MAG TPA: ComF family protein [Ktedonobacterales bacterium]
MSAHPSAGTLSFSLLDLIFPPRCVTCGARGASLCSTCLATFRLPEHQTCARCQRPLAPDSFGAPPVGLCGRCQDEPSAGLAGLLVAARYEAVARQAILAFKYHRQRRLADPLGSLLARRAEAIAPVPTLVISVPLHYIRQRQRGFNQAELLARRCAARLGLPFRADLIVRTRATRPQVGLGLAERQANVAGAFAITRHASAQLAGRRILLVDDVCTTGATMASAAGALLAGGASSVWGLAVARPTLDTTD